VPGFTKRLWRRQAGVVRKIYDDALTAIAREKELKKWRRDWKIRLIEEQNPGWVDLYPGISKLTIGGYGFRARAKGRVPE